jgi:hypothetical protein
MEAVMKKLTTLPCFRVVSESRYVLAGNTLRLRYVIGDRIALAESGFAKLLAESGAVSILEAIGMMTPTCCEECSGIKFVQKIVIQNKREIEVLECAEAAGMRPCRRQHKVLGGRVSGLSPSEDQIRIASELLFKRHLSEKRYGHSRDACEADVPEDQEFEDEQEE